LLLTWALTAGLLLPGAGCTRPFYRKKADEEVSEVLAQKDKYAAWKIENWHVYPDPRARFADTGDPDHPAKPPDDPAAYAMSPNPQKPGKAGVARTEGTGYLELIAQWDRENRARRAEEEAKEKEQDTKPDSIGPPIPPPAPPPPPRPGMGTARVPDDGLVQTAAALPAAGPALNQELPDPVKVAQPGQPPAPAPAPAPGNGSQMVTPTVRDAIVEARERSLLDVTGQPTYLLTLDQAAELAMFNSREYQDARENLFIAALPVTQERFAFIAQAFAAQEAIRAYTGRDTPRGQTSTWTLNNGTGFSKILPTGALLLLSFSNQTIFSFLNPKTITSVTTLNFSAIQPFLRGGGWVVGLESLTQAERNLVYAIRDFARFRKQLYVEIASNNGGSINGASFQPSGVLSNRSDVSTPGLGVSGLNPGVIPSVPIVISTPHVSPNSPGFLSLAPAITPPPSGYLNTMLQKIQVYIDQENIDVLVGILLRFRGLLEGDVVGPLQVQSVEQQLLSGRAQLLTDQEQYLASLDAFKIAIGVPMQISIEMDDSVLRPLLQQFRKARAIIDNEQIAVSEATRLIDLEKAPVLRRELLRLFQESALVRGTNFARTIRGRLAEVEKLPAKDLLDRIGALEKQVQELLREQALLQKRDQQLSPADQARLRDLNNQLDLARFEQALRLYESNYVENGKPKKPADPAGERQRIRAFQNVLSAWQKVLVEARDGQWAAVQASWPELPRACVDGVDLMKSDLQVARTAAARHALENRLDLMNVRGQVVDSWRQLAIYANSLLGVFNVSYTLNTNSPLTVPQPTNIGGSGNANQLELDTELPIVRIKERNNYRASLIAYNRQRRALQEAEDLAVQVVYSEVYNLRLYANQYKLQQRQLELAYLTIDSSLESLQAPVAPGRSATDGPAALTQQLLSAQRSLPTAQNALLTVWINYLNQRLALYRDLELMPLDQRGVWIDEIKECDCGVLTAPPETPLTPAPAGPRELPAPTPVPLPLLPAANREVK
jgi:hypothetical protein